MLPTSSVAPGQSLLLIGLAQPADAAVILLEEGHCLREQALAFCRTPSRDAAASLGAASLTTVMQMVANGYGGFQRHSVTFPTAPARSGRDERSRDSVGDHSVET